MMIELARNVCGLIGANSREFDSVTPHPVIDLMDEQREVVDMGGTMRLGVYPARLLPGSQVATAYGDEIVYERHRHRYEVNPRTAIASKRAGSCARAPRPTVAWSSSWSCPGTRSGSGPRPIPSSRAGPTGLIRLFDALVAASLRGGPGVIPSSSTSTIWFARPRWADRQRGQCGIPSPRGKGALPGIADLGGPGTFAGPDGSPFERDIVHHPGAVSAVPLVEPPIEVIMVRQYRAAVDRELLEIPAGKRDVAGEAPEVTAHRELIEEIGMRAGRLERLGEFYNSPGSLTSTPSCTWPSISRRPRRRCRVSRSST